MKTHSEKAYLISFCVVTCTMAKHAKQLSFRIVNSNKMMSTSFFDHLPYL